MFWVYGIGKGIVFKKVKLNVQFCEFVSVFNCENVLKDEVVVVGENVFFQLYNVGFFESFDLLCYFRFCQRVVLGKVSLQFENLCKIDKCFVYE